MQLELQGYIVSDYDGNIGLSKSKEWNWTSYLLTDLIAEEARKLKSVSIKYHDDGLGGTIIEIPDCSIVIYYTNKECSLVDAMIARDVYLEGGDYESKVDLEGYSEYTVTGYSTDYLRIGGHNLKEELSCHRGEYCHFIMESED